MKELFKPKLNKYYLTLTILLFAGFIILHILFYQKHPSIHQFMRLYAAFLSLFTVFTQGIMIGMICTLFIFAANYLLYFSGFNQLIGHDAIMSIIINVIWLTIIIMLGYTLHLNHKLKEEINKRKTLEGLLPICYLCKKVKDDKGYWINVENYLKTISDIQFTHGLCNDCLEILKKEHLN